MLEKSESKLVFDFENKTYDAPYSDSFVTKEAWVIVGSQKNPDHPMIILTQFYQVKFFKYTIMKKTINTKSEEGI